MNLQLVNTGRHFTKLGKIYATFALIGGMAALVYGAFSVSSITGAIVSVPVLVIILGYWVILVRVYAAAQVQSAGSTHTSDKSSTLTISSQRGFSVIDDYFDALEHIIERLELLVVRARFALFGAGFFLFLIYELVLFCKHLLNLWGRP
jgi:hypothetical protein